MAVVVRVAVMRVLELAMNGGESITEVNVVVARGMTMMLVT